MKDNGHRLSMSIMGNNFSVTDNTTGDTVIYNNDEFIIREISDDILFDFCTNIIDLFGRNLNNTKWLHHTSLDRSNKHGVIIIEESHYVYNILAFGRTAILTETVLQKNCFFQAERVISLLNRFSTLLMNNRNLLNPKINIVRRIPDVGLLVWVFNSHTVVSYESNVMGNIMLDCFIDKEFYHFCYVYSDFATNECTLYDAKFNPILTLPCDDSVKTYYPMDSASFEDQDVG